MNRPLRSTAQAWTWNDRDRGTCEPTVMISNGKARIIVTPEKLRQIADLMHDQADIQAILERKDTTS